MEIISPIFFISTYLSSPLSPSPTNLNVPLKLTILPLLFVTHYLNRALISPLVLTPSRSKSHILVPLVGVLFNITNGSLLGSYLSSETTISYLIHQKPSSTFWLGIGLWLVGFVGNVYHDEILFRIRRKAESKGKYKEETGQHYAIPTGGLYTFISYPNYLCEWLEWLGFAIAAAPFPVLLDFTPSSVLTTPSQRWFPSLTPPYIFLISLICLMLPRAYRGHEWYILKFGDRYPKERKAVIPFVL
jgi:3-oxo-5-alpha-steroid 4-dehydrogenase 1